MPEISIIVPVYKAEKCIGRCVNSLLNQVFTDFELILVNDGSPDESGDVCESLAREDDRIIVLYKDNGGVSSARNAGLNIARGKYIMFCDSDDSVFPTWASTLHRIITQNGVDLAISHYQKIVENFALSECNTSSQYESKIIFKENIWNIYKENLLNSPWNKIFKRKIIEDNNIRFNENLSDGEDLLFNLQYLVHAGKKIAITKEKLYCYYDNTNSLTTGYIKDFWQVKKYVLNQLKKYMLLLGAEFEDFSTEFYTKYLDAALRCINNTFKKSNTDSFWKKFKTNCQIMKSSEFYIATTNSDLTVYNKVYALCLKSRCYMLLWIYGKISKLIVR